jgi:hypothetical protein
VYLFSYHTPFALEGAQEVDTAALRKELRLGHFEKTTVRLENKRKKGAIL